MYLGAKSHAHHPCSLHPPNYLDPILSVLCKHNRNTIQFQARNILHILRQTHISIQRALNDECEKVYLFGEPNTEYFNQYVKPLCNDNVIVKGFMDDKQKMYDMIGKVYSSSISEVASLVKDECILTGTEFVGTNSTSHENIYWGNEKIINEWKRIFKL